MVGSLINLFIKFINLRPVKVFWLLCLLCNVVFARLSDYKSEFSQENLQKRQYAPILLSSDFGAYDQLTGIFKAEGRVVVRQVDSVLYADTLIYDEKKDQLIAFGNVRLEYSFGDVLFCERVNLSGDLKEGILSKVRIVTREKERFTAQRVYKKSNAPDELDKASYTPCAKCSDDLDPLWSLHASRMIYDKKDFTVHYTDAYLKFLDLPILYAPYFYFPTKRSTGILSPYISSNQELGPYVGIPYYWNIAPDKDLTLTPFVMTKGGAMLAPKYRQRFSDGEIKLEGAINGFYRKKKDAVEKKPYRGYVRGYLAYDFNEHWRLRSNEEWTTDKTFFSTRPFFGQTTASYLESTTKIEGFYDHHFMEISGIHYQGLQEQDRQRTEPIIYPETNYFYNSPQLWNNSFVLFHVNTLSLYKKLGDQVQRAMINGKWTCPINTTWGQDISVFTNLDSSIYYVRQQPECSGGIKTYNTVGRFFPQFGIESNFPLQRGDIVVTPMVQFIVAPSKINVSKIPNEDSQHIAFDDANLFAKNRFFGFDKIDEGSRVNYGLAFDLFSKNHISVFLGQSYAFTKPSKDLSPVGIYKGVSDFVGRADVQFPYGKLLYRFRCDHKTCAMRLQEIGWQVGAPVFLLSGSYAFSPKKKFSKTFASYNQLFATISSQMTQCWTAKFFITQDFKASNHKQLLLDKGVGLEYQNECLSVGITLQHSRFRMKDIKPGYGFSFYIQLKNLGQIGKKEDRFSRNLQ